MKLSIEQSSTLRAMVRKGTWLAGGKNRTCNSLRDRGLAAVTGSSSTGWVAYWNATDAGRAWVAANPFVEKVK